MSLFKHPKYINIISIFTIAFLSIIFLFNNLGIKAQSQQSSRSSSETSKLSFNPPPVKDNGAPGGRRKGAGSHSLCQVINQEKEISPLIALMPEIVIETETKSKTYVWGKTALDHPTLWFYIAYPVNTYVEFIIQDEAENEIYQTTFTLNKTPGIVSLTLPEDQINLETGRNYHWYFNIICNPEDTTDDFVEGWIEKVELNRVIKTQLESVQPLEDISIYADNGLWYDTLTNLDRMRQSDPGNQAIATIWSDLLRQVGLDEISQEPVVQRYNLAN